ncbi:hypothetical protein [Buttiauxella sp. S19-1]|uniref:hypothetical protein n=1 Tax=Buttiauxella sp. S19-1 TaxID=941430 RepID=UPI001EDC7E56|nr:hypothetical protein [Buttiauxella sp. S19-1]
MNHFIHYIRRNILLQKNDDIVAPPFYAARKKTPESIYYPTYHITRSTQGPASRIKPGDVIWIVAQLYSPWDSCWQQLPPGLDMKLIVKSISQKVVNDRPLLRFRAAEGSMWFPYKNAVEILIELQTLNQNNTEMRLWGNPEQQIGYYLQSIRQLKDGAKLQEWASNINLEPFDFISYRIKDGTFQAWLQVAKLIHEEKVVFWDRWTLPRRMVERREFIDDKILTDFLQQKIQQCRQVIPIQTDLYGAPGSYSALEKAYAIGLGKLKP